MILKGSQRGGAGQLARHLLKAENEHVGVHELRGFAADDLPNALQEAYAVSRGTRCRQFLFSLSLNPPDDKDVPIPVFEEAIAEVEHNLGLEGQPRAIVFHEKEGRRHAHVVWSRINVKAMKAINLPHYKLKLRDISRELYLEQGWQMPRGLMNSAERNPLNFSRAEWQQARRTGHDPRALKGLFQECWAVSDSGKAFSQALQARGFYLARGDRRGYVAVDFRGEVYAIAKWTGLRTKDVKARLGDPARLPSLADTRAMIATRMSERIKGYVRDAETAFQRQNARLSFAKADMVQRHRDERVRLKEKQKARWLEETKARSARLTHGLRGVWHWLTGKQGRIEKQNEREALEALKRDRAQSQAVIEAQLKERRVLQGEILRARQAHAKALLQLHKDIAHYMSLPEPSEAQRLSETFRQAQQVEQQRRRRRPRHDPGPSL